MSTLLDTVAALPLFRLVEREDLALFVRRAQVRDVAEGATVLRAGQRSDQVLLVLSGALEASVDGTGFPIRPGEVLGEAGLFTFDMPSSFTVVATRPSRVLAFEVPPRRGEDPVGAAVERAMLTATSRRIRLANTEVKKAWKDADGPAPQPEAPTGGLADRILGLFGR